MSSPRSESPCRPKANGYSMNRSERRHFEKKFRTILRTAGNNCGICKSALTHNCKTYGGYTSTHSIVLTSDCCKHKIEVLVEGVYITKDYDSVKKQEASKTSPRSRPTDAAEPVNTMQSYFNTLDTVADEVGQKAGLTKPPNVISVENNPWKSDDAQWFKTHPDRSHRMRLAFADETVSLPPHFGDMPAGHELVMLVRQVEVGKRVRIPFARNTSKEIPDEEAVIHALFDIASKPQKSAVVKIDDVQTGAAKYRASDKKNPT